MSPEASAAQKKNSYVYDKYLMLCLGLARYLAGMQAFPSSFAT